MTRRLVAILLAALAPGLWGCSAAHRGDAVRLPSPSGCEDLLFRGRFLPGEDGGRPSRFRANLRVCEAPPLLFEIRGRVGGAVLSGAVGKGQARWILPRQRLTVDGPDDPVVWRAWTGLPLSESMLRRLLGDLTAGESSLGDWSIRREVVDGEFSASASSRAGDSLHLVLARRTPALAAALWPEPPATFRALVVTVENPRPEEFHGK